jgi:hypothetical protein
MLCSGSAEHEAGRSNKGIRINKLSAGRSGSQLIPKATSPIGLNRSRLKRRESVHEGVTQDLSLKLDKVRERLREAEERSCVLTPRLPKASLNLTKRSKVIRMSRRGARRKA